MPHSLFIGSALATQDRVEFREASKEVGEDDDSELTARSLSKWQLIKQSVKRTVMHAFKKPPPNFDKSATRHSDHENNPYGFVRAHLYHGIIDVAFSLLGFAVLINSLYAALSIYY